MVYSILFVCSRIARRCRILDSWFWEILDAISRDTGRGGYSSSRLVLVLGHFDSDLDLVLDNNASIKTVDITNY